MHAKDQPNSIYLYKYAAKIHCITSQQDNSPTTIGKHLHDPMTGPRSEGSPPHPQPPQHPPSTALRDSSPAHP